MTRKRRDTLFSAKGMTLIEILASITILSIIVVSFLTFFIQSAHTNNVSEDVLDATYVAQAEMEKIIQLSEETSEEFDPLSLSSSYEKDNYYIDRRLEKRQELYRVIVKVYNDSSMSKLEAQMETLVSWGN